MFKYFMMKNASCLFYILVAFLSISCDSVDVGKSIETRYPTEDWVIADYVVTDTKFGAKAEKGFDNRAAFQAAIDSAYYNGGGVVFVPAGNYEFHTTQTGNKKVRSRKGSEEVSEIFEYEYVLKLRPGVQLRGDWIDPVSNNGRAAGTILEVYAGKNAANYDGSVESWWNDSQANNKLNKSYTSIADRFIEMNEGTGVTNLSVWYPEQNIENVTPYPWTLFQAQGDCATIKNVTLVNSYNGFYSAPSELHYLKDCYITALNKGIEVHVCTDIGRIEDVTVSPAFWSESGLMGSPSINAVKQYTKSKATGFKMHRSDWEYISGLKISDCNIGIWIGREPGFSDSPNAQLYGIDICKCNDGLYIEDVNPYGLLISNSKIGADGNSVYFHNDFHTSVQFNGVDFCGKVQSDGSAGVISFENCCFHNNTDYNISVNSGNVLLTQCHFNNEHKHVFLGKNSGELKSVNSGYKGNLSVDKMSQRSKVEILHNSDYSFTPIPDSVITDIAIRPRPVSNKVLRMDLPKAFGFNNEVPTMDISEILQSGLNNLKAAGGGTLYLPAGRYLLGKPIVVPSGVELRGSWDVQHHTQSGGTALFTNYDGGEKGENGESLIQLEEKAGLNGLTLAQLNIISDGCDEAHPRKTPFLIQGKGKNVYVINVTVSIGDKGIDLASYDTSGHYVDFFAGVLLRAGIWVGGGSEGGFIRNMQFNPHYSERLPEGGQGYPKAIMTKYIQSHCSALKFADVRRQTIFNNFVFGSVYGIHFLKDRVTGKCPGNITMIGHGSDGCTFSLFLEDGDDDTHIVAINSELVNTNIEHQSVRSYILVGDRPLTTKVSPLSQLTLYNSAFWGSPVYGSIINNGILTIHQGNFARSGLAGLNIYGGKASVYSTFFAQKINEKEAHVRVVDNSQSVELVNNYYASSLKITNGNEK